MDPRIKCTYCLSFIHTTEQCWNRSKIYCWTDSLYKEECDCHSCTMRIKCRLCRYKTNLSNIYGFCNGTRCEVCNEHMLSGTGLNCIWDHGVPICDYCDLPIRNYGGLCANNHCSRKQIEDKRYKLCGECGLPEVITHKHDGTRCFKCDTLLNEGRCIYKCRDGSASCGHCGCEEILYERCRSCGKTQSGKLTKRAVK